MLSVLLTASLGCDRQPNPPARPQSAPAPAATSAPAASPSPIRSESPAPRPPPARAESVPLAPEPVKVDTELVTYDLRLDEGALNRLQRNPYGPDTCPATFVAGEKTYESVRVRFRGQWSRMWPKKSYKIIFGKEHPFEGATSLNLNSSWRDPAFVREPLAYHVYARCGVPAPRCRVVRLRINGQFHGLFVEVEQPGKRFLAERGLKGTTLYKTVSRNNACDERDLGSAEAYARHYERESDKEKGYEALREFCGGLARATDAKAFFAREVDIDKYLNYLAATALTQNWDCYNKNHYLAHDLKGTGKWFVVPWDLDRTLGDHWNQSYGEARFPLLQGTRRHPGITGWNRLADRFLGERELRIRFLDRLQRLLEDEFTPERLFPVVDRYAAAIGDSVELDRQRWPGPAGDFAEGIAGLKRFIKDRREFLLREVARQRRLDATAASPETLPAANPVRVR